MPELPRNVICGFNLNQVPPPIAVLLSKLPPEQQNQLNQLPQEKRIAALQGLLTRQMVLRNQQMGQQQGQAGSQGSGMAAHGPGDVAAGQMVVPPGMVPGVPGVPGVMGGHPGQMPNPGMGLPAGIGQPHGGIHQRSGSGSGGVGGLGNVSLDVLQSFMQRKPDGPNVGHD